MPFGRRYESPGDPVPVPGQCWPIRIGARVYVAVCTGPDGDWETVRFCGVGEAGKAAADAYRDEHEARRKRWADARARR